MSDVKPSQSSSLDDWLCYLEQIHPATIEMGLERVRQVANQLELLNTRSNIILIAGTNGKGTTAQCLESLLLAQGYSVGTYASPHLIRYNERVRINGEELADQVHVDAFNELEQGRGETSLTYFEYGTLGALSIFKRFDVDYVLLEVGLGGRYDATNIVEPIASVITTIDLDHKEYLGDTRELVGYDKAGVFRANKPAIVGDLDVPHTVTDYAQEIAADLCLSKRDFIFTEQASTFGWQFQEYDYQFDKPSIPAQNAATALTLLAKLSLLPTREVIASCLEKLTVPGRMQVLSEQPKVIVDVAHNRESAQLLAKRLAQFKAQGLQVHAIVAMLKDKEHHDVLAPLKSVVSKWYVSGLPDNPRGYTAQQLAQTMAEQIADFDIQPTVDLAIEQALAELNERSILMVFGSFFTVAQAITYFQNKKV